MATNAGKGIPTQSRAARAGDAGTRLAKTGVPRGP
ncbi:hypothetical protein BPC006_II0350 [Burkholderia pseudomallei BPC006]|nr:hypothetical protein BPC006_II0350 [Burkholderia pseudomallei BPC006]